MSTPSARTYTCSVRANGLLHCGEHSWTDRYSTCCWCIAKATRSRHSHEWKAHARKNQRSPASGRGEVTYSVWKSRCRWKSLCWVAYIIMQPRRYCVVSKERLTQMLWPWPLTFYLFIYYHARWQPDIQLYKHDTAIQKFLKNIKQHRNNEITSPQTWQMNSKSVL